MAFDNNERKKRVYAERRLVARLVAAHRNNTPVECAWCGTTENLQLDHVDRFSAEVKSNRLHMVSLERFFKEIFKLQLLCITCHAFKSNEERRGEIHYSTDKEGRRVPTKLLARWESCDDECPF